MDLEERVIAVLQENSACHVYTTVAEPEIMGMLFGKYLSHYDVHEGRWYCFDPLHGERHERFQTAGIEVKLYDNEQTNQLRKSA